MICSRMSGCPTGGDKEREPHLGNERGAAIIGRQAQVQGVGAYNAGLPVGAHAGDKHETEKNQESYGGIHRLRGSRVLRGDERGAAIIGRQAQVQGVGAYTAGLPIRAPRRVQLDPAGLPLSSDLHVLHALSCQQPAKVL